MLGAIQQAGLDPARGLLHESVSGREALVLDLIEPLRPAVDVVVLNLLERVLTPADFTTNDTDGCRLTKDGRARFYQAWATARKNWPDLENSEPDAVRSLRQVCQARVAWLRMALDKYS